MNNREARVLNDLIKYQAETDPARTAILFDDERSATASSMRR